MVNKKMPVEDGASDEHKENYVSYIVAERGGKVKHGNKTISSGFETNI